MPRNRPRLRTTDYTKSYKILLCGLLVRKMYFIVQLWMMMPAETHWNVDSTFSRFRDLMPRSRILVFDNCLVPRPRFRCYNSEFKLGSQSMKSRFVDCNNCLGCWVLRLWFFIPISRRQVSEYCLGSQVLNGQSRVRDDNDETEDCRQTENQNCSQFHFTNQVRCNSSQHTKTKNDTLDTTLKRQIVSKFSPQLISCCHTRYFYYTHWHVSTAVCKWWRLAHCKLSKFMLEK